MKDFAGIDFKKVSAYYIQNVFFSEFRSRKLGVRVINECLL